uniref:Uncharacterized protein n=1 Tax=Anguilla anguilla TaxID=7936 RepID=A0A0E9RT55_ANGAN
MSLVTQSLVSPSHYFQWLSPEKRAISLLNY